MQQHICISNEVMSKDAIRVPCSYYLWKSVVLTRRFENIIDELT